MYEKQALRIAQETNFCTCRLVTVFQLLSKPNCRWSLGKRWPLSVDDISS